MEKNRLLANVTEDDLDRESQQRGTRTARNSKDQGMSWIPAILVVYSLVTTAFLIIPRVYHFPSLKVPYSPISNILQPSIQYVYLESHSIFSKEPSNEVNSAWAELIAPMLIQASEAEVIATNEDPSKQLELTQGGYLASLGVFHELHCLRRLYWHMYEDIYFTNITETDRESERDLARQCIETIRMSLMCQANTALYTFEWDENPVKKKHLTSKATRQCIRWDPIHDWARERSVGLDPQFHIPKKSLSLKF